MFCVALIAPPIARAESPPELFSLNPRVFVPLVALSSPGGATDPPGETLDPDQGGTISTPDGRLTVTIPPGAFTRPTEVTIASSSALPSEAVSDLGLVRDITARDDQGQPVTTLAKPATIAFRYDDSVMTLVSPSEYVIYARGSGGAWTALPTIVDTAQRVASAQTEHFSNFGLFAPALTGRLGGPYVGDVSCIVSDNYPVGSMGMDNAGNLYFLHGKGDIIYRKPPNSGREVLYEHFDVRTAYSGTDTAHTISVDPVTGVIYLRRDLRVFRIGTSGFWSQLYPPVGDDSCRISAMRFDSHDRTVWVTSACGMGQDTVWSYKQLNADTGQVLRTLPTSTRAGLPIADSQGRIFGRGGFQDSVSGSYLGTLMMWDEARERWRPVAEGFLGGGLTADDQGNVYVASADSNAISVVRGEEPFVTGVIWIDRRPSSIQYAHGRLIVSSGGAITTIPASRRDGLDGNSGRVTTSYTGTVSGNGSWVTLTGDLSTIPAHHAVWVGDVRLRLVSHTPDELRFVVPHYLTNSPHDIADDGLPFVGYNVRMTIPSGEMKLWVGPQRRSFGQLETPELGQFRPHRHTFSNTTRDCTVAPLDVATGEWVIWRLYSPSDAHTLTSAGGGFTAWSSEDGGTWVAHRFPESGEFTFYMSGSAWGTDTPCTIRVTDDGDPYDTRVLRVDPTSRGVYYINGTRLEIPAGALPGTDPYTVTIRTRADSPPASDTPQPVAVGYRRGFEFRPEPERLDGDIVFGVLRGSGTDYPRPAFYDNALDDQIPEPYRQKTYIPLTHTVDDALGYVNLLLPAGDYPGMSEGDEPELSSVRLSDASPTWGQRLRAKVNDIGANVWFKVGLPNEKLEDDHFTIVYNTREGISGFDAYVVMQSLKKARKHFASEGYAVPNWVIVRLHKDNTIGGSASGLGRAFHWKMTVGAWQTDDEMRSAAAHELFHIIQYQNMSVAARARKNSWTWWMEGTAVWAETVIYPDGNSAGYWVEEGADFIERGLDNYGSLTEAQEYACVALVTHLENTKSGAVLRILKKLGALTGPADALEEEVGFLTPFYEELAIAYFGQQDEPFKSWDITRALSPTVTLSTGDTALLSGTTPKNSVRAFQIVASTALTVPVSFSEATGSVLRTVQPHNNQITTALNKGGDVIARIYGRNQGSAPTSRPEGSVLPKAETFTAAHPLRVFYVNGESSVTSVQIYLDVPTLDSVSPDPFDSTKNVDIWASGSGFGSVPGYIYIGSTPGNPASSWTPTSAKRYVPGGQFVPGSLAVYVEHAAGVNSNSRHITAE